MKHTLGPWKIEKDEKDEFVQYWIFGPNGRFDYPEMIVTRGVKESSQTTIEQTEANLKLIAAAPAMYEEIKSAVKELRELQRGIALSGLPAVTRALIEKQIMKLEAALSLAEGRETVTT